MEFGIKKYAMLIMESGEKETTEDRTVKSRKN